MKKGTGQFIVNGLQLEQYLCRETDCMFVKQPLELTNNTDHFDFKVT
ncbi:30S ribosomal protein S9, partial [Francisella tularensis subsp. holarctica]|nr:30S ribosomal protein S9 [Francisella tularensis subsp. holarctica]